MVDQPDLVITGHSGFTFTERCLAKVGLLPPIAKGDVAMLHVSAALSGHLSIAEGLAITSRMNVHLDLWVPNPTAAGAPIFFPGIVKVMLAI